MISALGATRERAGTGAAYPVPARHAQGRVARGFRYEGLGGPPEGAKRHPTNSKAMNGSRPFLVKETIPRNSSQPLHYSSGDVADGFKFRVMARHPDLSAMTGGGQDSKSCSPPFFFLKAYHTHSVSSSHDVAIVSVEEPKVKGCPKQIGTLPDDAIDAARKDHERLLVRLMVSPGDSEGAMHRAEQAFGLSYWCQHNLRHKRRASVEFAARVHEAWMAMLEQSVRRDMAELLANAEKTEAAQ